LYRTYLVSSHFPTPKALATITRKQTINEVTAKYGNNEVIENKYPSIAGPNELVANAANVEVAMGSIARYYDY